MNTPENKNSKHKNLFTSSIITIIIVVMLLLAGPANAVIVSITGLDGETIQQSGSKSFTVNVTLESFDKYMPIDSMSLNISGPVNKTWTFDVSTGTIITPSGDTNVTIIATDPPAANEYGTGTGYGVYGYGYGYGSDTGYSYGNFGYGYGYGYNSGAGGANVTFSYNITLDTAYLDVGDYTAQVHVNTGNTAKPKFSSGTASFTVEALPVTIPLDSSNLVNGTTSATSPRGDVVVTLPNGTNATYANGTPLPSITVNSTTNLPTAASTALSSNDRVIGEIVDLGPEGARFDPAIQIRFNYTEPLPSGVSESSLNVKFYNSTTGSWEALTTYEHNTTGNYIIANITHFSTYTVTGTVPAASTPSTGGGGGGSSGVSSGETFNNIERYETRDQFLYVDREVTYTFTSDIPVYELAVTATKNTDLISAKVELLKGTSTLVDSEPTGIVYKNLNIWLGTSGFATSDTIKDAAVRFKVAKEWLSDNKASKDEISLVKWGSGKWNKLSTSVINEDDEYVYYEAHTNSFSSFAIVAKSTDKEAPVIGPATPLPTEPPEMPGPETTAMPEETKEPEKTPGFGFAFALASLGVAYILYRKR